MTLAQFAMTFWPTCRPILLLRGWGPQGIPWAQLRGFIVAVVEEKTRT